jgi:FkbM family methyltransferase
MSSTTCARPTAPATAGALQACSAKGNGLQRGREGATATSASFRECHGRHRSLWLAPIFSTLALAVRFKEKLGRETKRLFLTARHKITGDFHIDYGWIRLPFSGDGDWQEVYYHQHQAEWREKDLMVFRSLVPPGSTVVDVGANMGFVTTILSGLVGSQGRVIAFEPSSRTFAKLQRTIRINGLSNVRAINAGCGASREMLELHDLGGSSGNASIVGEGTVRERIEVVRLDDVPELNERPIALIKIDTEGFEPHVLEGARRLIAEHKPTLYLEMGGDFVDSTRRTIELLKELGYDVRHVEHLDWSLYGNGSDFFFRPALP